MCMDLSAAFDTVDHGILLNVLSSLYGIGGSALSWFKSYLDSRSCTVNINKEYSAIQPLPFSVPQGSCAGPVLYNAYASSIKSVIPDHLNLYGYADDHALLSIFDLHVPHSESIARNHLQLSAQNIKSWMDSNRLKMNCAKTEYIIFSSRNQVHKISNCSLNVNDDHIVKSKSIRYLGTTLDENLSLLENVKSKCKKAMYNLRRIRSIRQFLTFKACEQLILSLVISHLDYANSLYAGLPKSTLKHLQRIQNMAAKVVLKLNRLDSSTEARRELHWLPIQQRIDFKILTLVYKTINKESPQYLRDLLQMVTYNDLTQSLRSNSGAQNLFVPKTKRKMFADRSFSVYGPKIWNSIPGKIRLSKNIVTFQTELKTYLFAKAYSG